MPEWDAHVQEAAREVDRRLVTGGLPPPLAKLYSHCTRLRSGQPGLPTWQRGEFEARLNDAVRLIELGFLKRAAGEEDWRRSVVRGAEVLEWLSHPEIDSEGLPLGHLSAAAYQLAGYPARSAGLLDRIAPGGSLHILTSFLRADFAGLLAGLVHYWGARQQMQRAGQNEQPDIRSSFFDETAGALGVLCAAMRWGDHGRLDAALEKLGAVSHLMLSGRDSFSWMLARICDEVARSFATTSIRRKLEWLPGRLQVSGKLAVERYLRYCYSASRALAWSSQIQGIEQLRLNRSFVLCTPTGSGKTTIAEIGIVQALFSTGGAEELALDQPLAMYLVPSRALAAEVEAKLLRVIPPLSSDRVIVTGLYGGVDWGPTDAWLSAGEKTILICTYEKAEALIRFLGPLFLNRLSLVVLDEAHSVQFDGNEVSLRNAENRPLRLESLISRLFTHLPPERSRIIALSAVASGFETALARWITGDTNATSTTAVYHSTRQLIGRLECVPGRAFALHYDLMDRADLRFEDGARGTPFVPQPFPPHPPAPELEGGGPELRIRPYLFWAAMHLVAPQGEAQRHAVLISVPQQIGGYAQSLLELLEGAWEAPRKPVFFEPPLDAEKLAKWQRCLRSCGDYFGRESREYRLLLKGIIVHHGKMPGLMARLLVELVQENVVHLVLATSTLSEGINLPFETILVPSLRRAQSPMTAREFGNLAGRAGRPGFGTEGRCLVLLHSTTPQARVTYENIIGQLTVSPSRQRGSADSPLAALLTMIWNYWREITHSSSRQAFMAWLEQSATVEIGEREQRAQLGNALDSLDGILLSAIVEVEDLRGAILTAAELEEKLTAIWRRCYAHFASSAERELGMFFTTRGNALVTRIFPEQGRRRRLYRTGLPPREGEQLLTLFPELRNHLATGVDYARWGEDERFEYIRVLVALLTRHPRFAVCNLERPTVPWSAPLRWWLNPRRAQIRPKPQQISRWFDYISQAFLYRTTWAVGSVFSIVMAENSPQQTRPISLDDWVETGLPWAAFWLKELLTWGTLEPVAAFLLARGRCETRLEAEDLATRYYAAGNPEHTDDIFDPRSIRDWAATLAPPRPRAEGGVPTSTQVELLRDFSGAQERLRVLPAEVEQRLYWFDYAGFALATSPRPGDWDPRFLQTIDFYLDPARQVVSSTGAYSRFGEHLD